jgi:hypothetical protein
MIYEKSKNSYIHYEGKNGHQGDWGLFLNQIHENHQSGRLELLTRFGTNKNGIKQPILVNFTKNNSLHLLVKYQTPRAYDGYENSYRGRIRSISEKNKMNK